MPKRQLFDRFPCDREPLEAFSHEIRKAGRQSGRQSLVCMSRRSKAAAVGAWP
jgi:hypothetical protein